MGDKGVCTLLVLKGSLFVELGLVDILLFIIVVIPCSSPKFPKKEYILLR